MKYSGGIHYSNGAERTYIGKIGNVSIIASMYTKKNKRGEWGKGKMTYFIDQEKIEYKTHTELKAELLKRELIRE